MHVRGNVNNQSAVEAEIRGFTESKLGVSSYCQTKSAPFLQRWRPATATTIHCGNIPDRSSRAGHLSTV